MASYLSQLLAELKRRKVTRVAFAYLVVAVGVVEGVDIIGTPLGLPGWVIPSLSLLVVAGFPVSLLLAWALEITPDGIQRTPGPTQEQLASHSPSRWSPSSWALFSASLFMLVAAGYVLLFRGSEEVHLPEGMVAVFPFDNLTGDHTLDDLGLATAHWITDGLDRVEGVEVLATNAVLQTAGIRGEGVRDLEIASALGAGTLVSGVITARGEDLEFRAQISEVSSGRVLNSVRAFGPRSERMAVLDDCRSRVTGSMAISVDDDPLLLIGSNAPAYEAYQAFLRAMESFVLGNPERCAEQASEAYGLDSNFLEALSIEASCLANQGRHEARDSLVAILEVRREELAPVWRLGLDYFRAVADQDQEELLRVTRQQARHNPHLSMSLALQALRAGRPEEALRADSVAAELTPLFGIRAPIFNGVCAGHLMLKRYEACREDIAQLPAQGRESFWVLQDETHALIGLERLEEIWPILSEMERMEPVESGWDYGSPGAALRNVATVLARFGHGQEAREVAERAVTWFDGRDPDGYAPHRAQALLLAERLEEAQSVLFRLFEDNPWSFSNRRTLGVALALSGDTPGALTQARWFEGADSLSSWGSHPYSRASILAHLGQRDEALRLLREALAEGKAFWEYSGENVLLWFDPNLAPLWGDQEFEELIAPRG